MKKAGECEEWGREGEGEGRREGPGRGLGGNGRKAVEKVGVKCDKHATWYRNAGSSISFGRS